MPFFEYRCNDCKGKFEIFTMSNKKTDINCTLCGSDRAHKIISPAGIVFKGPGFYVTDSRKSSYNNSVEDHSKDNSEKKTGQDKVKT
jgi:putative FmdB family regulatory protein